MYYSGAQPGANQCIAQNCEQLCFPKGQDTFTCKCAIGFKPTDETSEVCTGVKEFLLYSVGYELKGFTIVNNETENVRFYFLT